VGWAIIVSEWAGGEHFKDVDQPALPGKRCDGDVDEIELHDG
jgi:hypothetical protein